MSVYMTPTSLAQALLVLLLPCTVTCTSLASDSQSCREDLSSINLLQHGPLEIQRKDWDLVKHRSEAESLGRVHLPHGEELLRRAGATRPPSRNLPEGISFLRHAEKGKPLHSPHAHHETPVFTLEQSKSFGPDIAELQEGSKVFDEASAHPSYPKPIKNAPDIAELQFWSKAHPAQPKPEPDVAEVQIGSQAHPAANDPDIAELQLGSEVSSEKAAFLKELHEAVQAREHLEQGKKSEVPVEPSRGYVVLPDPSKLALLQTGSQHTGEMGTEAMSQIKELKRELLAVTQKAQQEELDRQKLLATLEEKGHLVEKEELRHQQDLLQMKQLQQEHLRLSQEKAEELEGLRSEVDERRQRQSDEELDLMELEQQTAHQQKELSAAGRALQESQAAQRRAEELAEDEKARAERFELLAKEQETALRQNEKKAERFELLAKEQETALRQNEKKAESFELLAKEQETALRQNEKKWQQYLNLLRREQKQEVSRMAAKHQDLLAAHDKAWKAMLEEQHAEDRQKMREEQASNLGALQGVWFSRFRDLREVQDKERQQELQDMAQLLAGRENSDKKKEMAILKTLGSIASKDLVAEAARDESFVRHLSLQQEHSRQLEEKLLEAPLPKRAARLVAGKRGDV